MVKSSSPVVVFVAARPTMRVHDLLLISDLVEARYPLLQFRDLLGQMEAAATADWRAPPGNFTFEEPSSWPQRIRQFERYRLASGLDGKAEDYQVNSFLYVMGDKSNDILSTLPLTDQQKAVYEYVRKAFDEHFVGKHNVIYECAKFNSRQQQQGESAENFITDVHKLAEHCRFGTLKEEMIRDRIVVGIRDSRLSERLQLDPDLTLAKTITQVRQQEEIKKQQQLLQGKHPRRPEQSTSKPNMVNKTNYVEKCKQLVTADALSRAPQGLENREANSSLEHECCAYTDHILRHLPATEHKLAHIREAQNIDSICKQLRTYTEKGWPPHRRSVHLLPFWPERNDIHMAEGLLLKGERNLIPGCIQGEMLQRLHEGHRGVTKCVARAQESPWWPGITRQIKELVERCEICCQYAQTKTEPLMPTPLPARPWQKVAADIFQWRNGQYIVVVDYYSQHMANLPTLTTSTTVEQLKVISCQPGNSPGGEWLP
ncbi:hypothetical protein ABVT39_020482 [Epinephelus coioides]